MGDGQKPNYKDIAFKVLWTAVAAGGGLLVAELADVGAWWALPATAVINSALAWVRQQIGATPPDAPDTTGSTNLKGPLTR